MKSLSENHLVKKVLILLSGSMLGTIIYFMFQPVITRLYTPTEMGMYAFIFSIVSMFSTVINGHYDLTIVSAEEEEDADRIAIVSFIFSMILILLIAFVLIILYLYYPDTLQETGIAALLSCIFLLVFSLNNILTSYNNRHQYYKVISKVSIYKNVGRSIFPILFALTHWGYMGLVIGNLLGYVFGMNSQSKKVKKNFKRYLSFNVTELKETALKYKKQPLFSAPGLLFVAMSNSIVAFFIAKEYGAEELGYFFFSLSILGIPIAMISTNVGKVFFQSATLEYKNTGKFYSSFKKVSFLLIIITVPLFTILFFSAEWIFGLVFGEVWKKSGYYVTLQIPMFAIRFVVTALMFGFIISNHQLKKLFLQSGFVISSVLSIVIANYFGFTITQYISLVNTLFMFNYAYIYMELFKISKKLNPMYKKERDII